MNFGSSFVETTWVPIIQIYKYCESTLPLPILLAIFLSYQFSHILQWLSYSFTSLAFRNINVIYHGNIQKKKANKVHNVIIIKNNNENPTIIQEHRHVLYLLFPTMRTAFAVQTFLHMCALCISCHISEKNTILSFGD